MNVFLSCVRLYNPMYCSPPGSSVQGILQARMLEWVAIPFSKGSPYPGMKPRSPVLQADSLLSQPPGKPKSHVYIIYMHIYVRTYMCTYI